MLRRLATMTAAVMLALAALGITTPPAAANPALEVPFPVGQTWYICQGYQTGTHAGSYSLDLTLGSTCHQTASDYAVTTSPGDGVVQWRWSEGICIDLSNGGAFKVGHISPEVNIGDPISLGQRIGLVRAHNDPGSANNGISHLHITIYTSNNCPEPPCPGCDTPNDVPFADAYGTRFACGPDLPAGQNHYGKALQRCPASSQSESGRFVTGDFDADGDADVAGMYEDSVTATTIHVWKSTRSSLEYSGDAGWWNSTGGYVASRVGSRFVAGDFDGDGDDDVAAFYDYGGQVARIHVWRSTGSSFAYAGDLGWWDSGSGYSMSQIGGRFVAGDFNGDRVDDVAAMYDYGSNNVRIHVWTSDRSRFNYVGDAGWWISAPGGYAASRVGSRFVAGDFDGDLDDDIAAMYEDAGTSTTIHVWRSSRQGFTYSGDNGWWGSAGGYAASRVGGRFVAGDFEADGDVDIAAMYEDAGTSTTIHVWRSTRSSFGYAGDNGWWGSAGGYAASRVSARFAAGNLDGSGGLDVAAFYDDLSAAASLHVWRNVSQTFSYAGDNGWWHVGSGAYDVNRL